MNKRKINKDKMSSQTDMWFVFIYNLHCFQYVFISIHALQQLTENVKYLRDRLHFISSFFSIFFFFFFLSPNTQNILCFSDEHHQLCSFVLLFCCYFAIGFLSSNREAQAKKKRSSDKEDNIVTQAHTSQSHNIGMWIAAFLLFWLWA